MSVQNRSKFQYVYFIFSFLVKMQYLNCVWIEICYTLQESTLGVLQYSDY